MNKVKVIALQKMPERRIRVVLSCGHDIILLDNLPRYSTGNMVDCDVCKSKFFHESEGDGVTRRKFVGFIKVLNNQPDPPANNSASFCCGGSS